jgi:alanine-glyoxylate transaminase / serine-glyoxylate transaminase / serine-pyruvate transaminase
MLPVLPHGASADRFSAMRVFTDESLTRLLLGPGPSPVDPRVLEALSRPVLGHLDPTFLEIIDDVSHALREVFRTANRMTFPVSGTGSAGMEAAIFNILEPGDEIVIGVNGVFGSRIGRGARRCGRDPGGCRVGHDRADR